MNKYISKVRKALGFDTELEEYIHDMEEKINAGTITKEEFVRYQEVVKTRTYKGMDPGTCTALATLGAAIIGVIGQIYRVNRITRYEDDDYVVTSRAINEK